MTSRTRRAAAGTASAAPATETGAAQTSPFTVNKLSKPMIRVGSNASARSSEPRTPRLMPPAPF
jgi:hypothetical protein